jgi:signal transduction histidine kinase/CheY-like chemotaxis protein
MAPPFQLRLEETSLHERLRAIVEASRLTLGDLPPEVARLLEAIDGAYREKDAEATALREELDARPSVLVEDHARVIAELRDRTSAVEAIIESLPDSYARISADGRFLDFRRPKGRDFTVAAEELRGRCYRDTLPAEAAAAWDLAIAQAKATGKTTVFEFVLPTPSGRLNREARFTPYLDDQIIAVIRSTTKDKEMQAKLLVADRMASLGTLAAGVAHEINNPLTYLVGNLEYAIEELPALLGDRQDDDAKALTQALADARVGAQRVTTIARGLRMFSRGDDDRTGPVDVGEVVESAVKLAMNELRHRARVVRELSKVPPVLGSEGRLVQVVLNLLVNAAHAIQAGHVDDNLVHVSTSVDEASQVVITVRDTGCGMPESVVARIFEPFFTTKDVGVGTGLGLSICHGIVTSLGGTLTAESEVGKGTVFRVALPALSEAGPTSARPPPNPPEPHATRRGRVLVVDDEPLVGLAIQRLLEGEHEVKVVAQADQGVAAITAGDSFDIIFCDLMMPVMTGMDFYSAIAACAPAQAARIVFMTGGAFTDAARRFLNEIANPWFEKPLSMKSVRELVASRCA